jgi:hypothetical protein
VSRRQDKWIVPHNWQKFQHYKDRRPPWIKLHTDLFDHPAWQRLSLADKGLLECIWLLYAKFDGELTVRDLVRMTGNRVTKHAESAHFVFVKRSVLRLNHAGLIHVLASTPLAQEVEVEREKAFKPVTRDNQNSQLPDAVREWLDAVRLKGIE